MAKLTLNNITAGYNSATQINANNDLIETALENTLSRDGTTPNTMSADLDLNSNDLLNAGTITATAVTVAGENLVPATKVPNWEGAWVTATAYAVDDLVQESGNSYICLVAHTSGTFATDLSAAKWELFAQKGSAGAGTGDMLAANNLSDVANTDTSLTNLGGGSVGIAIFKDTTAADVRTEISAQQQNDILDDLAGLTQATNKIPYFNTATTASVLDFKDEDNMASDSAVALSSQQSIKAYVDTQVSSVASAWTFLGTYNAAGEASKEFTSEFDATKYDAYAFVIGNMIPATDNAPFALRTSTNGGSTWDQSTGNYHYAFNYIYAADTSAAEATSGNFLSLGRGAGSNYPGSAAGEDGVGGILYLHHPHLAKKTYVTFQLVYISSTGGIHTINGAGYRASSADVDGIQFYFTSGNIESGTITMYGLRNA